MHPNAKTNIKIRSYIQKSNKSVSELSTELGVSRVTIRKWKNRNTVEDKSHAVNNISKTLKKQEENILIFLRELLNLSIDDMLIISQKIFRFHTSRSSLGRLVRERRKNEDVIYNYIDNKNCTKLLIFHPKSIDSNYVYILIANTKTKIFHISWVNNEDRIKVFDHLCNALMKFENEHILISRESDDSQNYLEGLQKIYPDKKMIFELYKEAGLRNLSQEELISSLTLIISRLENVKDKSYHLAFRVFRFIYNHKTPLSSLRKKTPKHLAI